IDFTTTAPSMLVGLRSTKSARGAYRVPSVPARGDPQLAADVHDVLRRLSPEHRAILVLRDLEDLDEQTVAAMLEVPKGTVKSRLARARASFRKAWTE
ncbi:sigma factor-like helix-turn-helix DNA-binding protein, partial [Hamadaea sp. NPDC051192]|uniref:sigma factor-like helix-turn-helix DNA-binding protein n=1 Tax=Hamadaea sp. NPDC051192 TaxID=3154940 RepID=UPI00343879E2